MDRVYCFKNCPSKFCIAVCPSGALVVKENKVVVASNRCYGCNLCRHMCMTWNVIWEPKK